MIKGKEYWVAWITGSHPIKWQGDYFQQGLLDGGLVYETKEEADKASRDIKKGLKTLDKIKALVDIWGMEHLELITSFVQQAEELGVEDTEIISEWIRIDLE